MNTSPVPEDIRYLREKLATWVQQHVAHFPWRSTTNPWHALVAEIMLQRTRAEQVLPVYEDFVSRYESPASFAASPDPALFTRLGLHWRLGRLVDLADVLADRPLPRSKAELLALPAVGEYVASAFLSLHVGVRQPIIDSNVVRLYSRFFGFATAGETRRKKWFIELADSVTPQKGFREFNYALIDFTRAICRPRAHHDLCPLAVRCSDYRTSSSRPAASLAHRGGDNCKPCLSLPSDSSDLCAVSSHQISLQCLGADI